MRIIVHIVRNMPHPAKNVGTSNKKDAMSVDTYVEPGEKMWHSLKNIRYPICRKMNNKAIQVEGEIYWGRHYSVSVLLNHHQDHEG